MYHLVVIKRRIALQESPFSSLRLQSGEGDMKRQKKTKINGPKREIRGERGTPSPRFHAPFDRRRPVCRRSRKKNRGSEGLKGDPSHGNRSLSDTLTSTTNTAGVLFTFLSLPFTLSFLLNDSCSGIAESLARNTREDTMHGERGRTDEQP